LTLAVLTALCLLCRDELHSKLFVTETGAVSNAPVNILHFIRELHSAIKTQESYDLETSSKEATLCDEHIGLIMDVARKLPHE
jgi:hypothetical protein